MLSAQGNGGGHQFSVALHRECDAVTIDGVRRALAWHCTDTSVWIGTPVGDRELTLYATTRGGSRTDQAPALESPMPGTVVAVLAGDGTRVEAGDPVLAVEAMKMEHVLRAPTAGTVRVHVTEGQTVRRGEELAQVLTVPQETAPPQEPTSQQDAAPPEPPEPTSQQDAAPPEPQEPEPQPDTTPPEEAPPSTTPPEAAPPGTAQPEAGPPQRPTTPREDAHA